MAAAAVVPLEGVGQEVGVGHLRDDDRSRLVPEPHRACVHRTKPGPTKGKAPSARSKRGFLQVSARAPGTAKGALEGAVQVVGVEVVEAGHLRLLPAIGAVGAPAVLHADREDFGLRVEELREDRLVGDVLAGRVGLPVGRLRRVVGDERHVTALAPRTLRIEEFLRETGVARERVEVDEPARNDRHAVVEGPLHLLVEGAALAALVGEVDFRPGVGARTVVAGPASDGVLKGELRVDDDLAGRLALGDVGDCDEDVLRAEHLVAGLPAHKALVDGAGDVHAEDAVERVGARRRKAPRLLKLLQNVAAVLDGTLLRRAGRREAATLDPRVHGVQRRTLARRHFGRRLFGDEVLFGHHTVAVDEAGGGHVAAARRDFGADAVAVRELLEPVPEGPVGLRIVLAALRRPLLQGLRPARDRVEPAVADALALYFREVRRTGDVVGRGALFVARRIAGRFLGGAASGHREAGNHSGQDHPARLLHRLHRAFSLRLLEACGWVVGGARRRTRTRENNKYVTRFLAESWPLHRFVKSETGAKALFDFGHLPE
ncbi:hypothetical protein OUZ56_032661, partial [Daphnia magna]